MTGESRPVGQFGASPLSAYEQHGGIARFCRGSKNGVHVTFENGWVVSVQWGSGTYSGNHDRWEFDRNDIAPPTGSAEVACWHDAPQHDHMAKWVDGDTVQGYRSWEQVQVLLAAAASGSLAEPIDLWEIDHDR